MTSVGADAWSHIAGAFAWVLLCESVVGSHTHAGAASGLLVVAHVVARARGNATDLAWAAAWAAGALCARATVWLAHAWGSRRLGHPWTHPTHGVMQRTRACAVGTVVLALAVAWAR